MVWRLFMRKRQNYVYFNKGCCMFYLLPSCQRTRKSYGGYSHYVSFHSLPPHAKRLIHWHHWRWECIWFACRDEEGIDVNILDKTSSSPSYACEHHSHSSPARWMTYFPANHQDSISIAVNKSIEQTNFLLSGWLCCQRSCTVYTVQPLNICKTFQRRCIYV